MVPEAASLAVLVSTIEGVMPSIPAMSLICPQKQPSSTRQLHSTLPCSGSLAEGFGSALTRVDLGPGLVSSPGPGVGAAGSRSLNVGILGGVVGAGNAGADGSR